MKSIISLTSTLLLTKNLISASVLDFYNQAVKQTLKTEKQNGNDNFLGAFGTRTITQSDMQLVNEYGCWCYFENDHGKGKGRPVDEIDVMCKRLHDGYTCAIMDAENLGHDECIPWEVDYNSAVGSGFSLINMDVETIRSECDAQNPEVGCANWACKIEGYFVQQYFLYATGGGIINEEFRHENGFDPDLGCPIQHGVKSEKACCDEYPLRFPFKTYNGARDCCYTHTFNTNLYQCCGDGKVKMTC